MPLGMAFLIAALQCAMIVAVFIVLRRAVIQLLSDRTDVPFVKTPRKHFSAIADALALTPSDTVYELGSGDGTFLLWSAARFPRTTFVGIERNPLLVRGANRRAHQRRLSNVSFMQADLFETDLTRATKIYAYLLDPVMDRLLPKLEREFHGTLASRAFTFKDKAPTRTVRLSKKEGWHGEHLLYVYDF